MKIDYAMVLEVKTRKDELHGLLGPAGPISEGIYDTVTKIQNETNAEDEEKWWKLLDKKLEQYVQLRIELDRLERNK